ncbi:MAG: leucine-rich repeat protein, partial [Clostridia bacterium]|nr:leucine-rich repeat protein [Clostridia bacterium]
MDKVYTASVTVLNEEGEKVAGAVIYGTGREKDPITNEYGNARIPLRAGTYNLSVSKDNIAPVKLAEFKITDHDVVLPQVVIKEPRYNVTVHVYDEFWNVLPGAVVTVSETGETLYPDAGGVCSFKAKSGEYTLSAQSADGNFTGSETVNVNGRDKSASVFLTKETVTVTVTALTEENAPVQYMPVRVNGANDVYRTDEQGKVTFELNKGKYRFDAATNVYFGSAEADITKDTDITITLKKSHMEYSFDRDTGKLTISGEGAMPDYPSSANGMPWSSYILYNGKWLTLIKSVEVTGLTHIGNYAFSHCLALGSVTLSDSVVSIGDFAFQGCCDSYYTTETLSISLPDGLERIGDGAFWGSGLKSVTIPASVRY